MCTHTSKNFKGKYCVSEYDEILTITMTRSHVHYGKLYSNMSNIISYTVGILPSVTSWGYTSVNQWRIFSQP